MHSIGEKAKLLRRSTEYKNWRKNILERDDRRCVLCGDNKQIEVDHIKPFSLFPELALNLDNGRTLCHKCHSKTDTYGHLTKFKGESAIHPLLAGDLLYKIQSVPSSIEMNGQNIGFLLEYLPGSHKWVSGYKIKKIRLQASGDTIEESINRFFDILRKAATNNSERYNLINECNMAQYSNKILKKSLIRYVEKLVGRELTTEEKNEIRGLFKQAIVNYYEEVTLNS